MPPIRKYLRISRQHVLEVRIHLDNPADANRWLLHPRDPALNRVIQAVRPLITPKLREESEKRRKGTKKKTVKDVVIGDDFEVSIYLTDLGTPHAILKRNKTFVAKQTVPGTGTQEAPVEVDEDANPPQPTREESDDGDVMKLESIPAFESESRGAESSAESPMMVSGSPHGPSDPDRDSMEQQGPDDKKKLGMVATYQGFRIYEKVLSLVVTRTGGGSGIPETGGAPPMMDQWISSTQAADGPLGDD